VNNGNTPGFPLFIDISPQPPAIVAVTNQSGQSLLGGPAGPGDALTLVVSGLDSVVVGNPGRVQVTVSGVPMQVQQISALPNGLIQIQIIVTQSFGTNQVPLIVWLDGAPSQAVMMTVR
jgi:uncharacterized protein (TIGR03437 family)